MPTKTTTAIDARWTARTFVVLGVVLAVLTAGAVGWFAHDFVSTKPPMTIVRTFDATVGVLGDAGNGVLSGCVTPTDDHHDVCGAFTVVGPAVHEGDTVHAALLRYDNGRDNGVTGYYVVVLYPEVLGP